MPQIQVSNTTELQRALRDCEPETEIRLASGEYQGPFFIDRPVRLQGQRRQTPLWRWAGAVLIVRVPGVSLENLQLERTVLESGPVVVHQVGCKPAGGASVEIESDTLIDLGEIAPGTTVTVPITVATTGQAEIEATGVYGSRIVPNQIQSAGTHEAQLTLDGKSLMKGEIIFGEITIREQGAPRYIWITGSVLESPPETTPLNLSIGGRIVSFGAGGFHLNRVATKALEVEKISGDLFFSRDSHGALSLYLPDDPPEKVVLNGTPLSARSRRLILRGDVLTVGGLKIEAHPEETLPFSVDHNRLDFGTFGAQIPDGVTLNVTAGKSGWRGGVVSLSKWISVTPEGLFRVPPGRSHAWTLSLNEDALNLPDGTHEALSGVLIVGGGHALTIDAHIQVARPEVSLYAETIDFGEIEWGLNTFPTVDFEILNLGRGDWKGQIKTALKYLETSPNKEIQGTSWSSVRIQAKLLPDWENLREGVHQVAEAIRITPEKGDPCLIGLKVRITPARGHLSLPHPSLQFQEVERNTPAPTIPLEIHNTGAGPWRGKIGARQGWAAVELESLEIPAHGSVVVEVTLQGIPDGAELDKPLFIDQLILEAEDSSSTPYSEPIPVYLTVVERPPYLAVQPARFPPFVKGELPEGAITIYNLGPGEWRGRATSNLPWLTIPDKTFTCLPEEIVTIPVTLTDRAKSVLQLGVSEWEQAISIQGGREVYTTGARFDMREMPTELVVENPILNFGQIGESVTNIPPETLRLLNAGSAAWRGQISLNVDWLSFEHPARSFDLQINKSSVAEIKVFLNENALLKPPGSLNTEDALIISGGAQSVPIRVMAMHHETTPWVERTPRMVRIGAQKGAQIKVSNEGGRAWTLQAAPAPYLRVIPVEFTLSPGQAQTLQVELNPDAEELPDGDFSDPRGLVVFERWREIDIGVEVPAAVTNDLRKRREAQAAALAKAEREAAAKPTQTTETAPDPSVTGDEPSAKLPPMPSTDT